MVRSRGGLALLCVLGCLADLSSLDVSSTDELRSDVVAKGKVAPSWLLLTLQPSRLIDKSSYLQFFVVYPAGDLRLTVSSVEGSSVTPGLYDKVPERGDQPSLEVEVKMCDEEGLDAHFFYLELECVASGITVLRVTATDPTVPEKAIHWYLQKHCRKGVRGDLRVFVDGELATTRGRVLPAWSSYSNHLDQTANITLAVRTGNQKIEEIVVESSLQPQVRGMGAHGGVVSKPFTFFLSFSCDKDIPSGNVTVVIPDPPYTPLSLSFVYECPVCDAQNHSQHLPAVEIGSELGLSDIVHRGVPVEPYDKGMEVNPDTFFSTFYVSAPDQVKFEALQITSNMRVLEPVLQCGDQNQKCVLHYRCINDGTARLTVTLPLRHLHQGIEFAYAKRCRRPKISVTEEVVTDSSLYVVGITVVLIAVWMCACWQGKKAPLKSIELGKVPI